MHSQRHVSEQYNPIPSYWYKLSHAMRLWFFSSSVNNIQTRMRSHPVGCLIFGLLPYFICANSEGSGETARMRRLSWAFAGRLCDKHQNFMGWLIWPVVTRDLPDIKYSSMPLFFPGLYLWVKRYNNMASHCPYQSFPKNHTLTHTTGQSF